MKTLAMLALALAALYAALCLLVFATQRRQIYYPTVESHAAEADALRLPVQEAELKIWSVERGGADALVYFGGWRPWGVLLGALLFSMVNSLQLWIQVLGIPIPSDIAVMLPYLLTIVALVVAMQRMRSPSALTKAFEREG